ncbi:GNAT family N-acetyltransferase [Pseudomonas oryzihabitans]|uniref:GNAT family N-acetyltransferase n=1 Tax=Pseudomonas oryzihabitans TaxID=47885 RepID=UPI00111E1A3A|nr:GNAT family N-acetyltransferase [Pseudomonas psychrotolerans]QDD90548.1 GNAT family N-acetyltransferase [Pseudomonas psychrotolerans]
MIIRPLTPADHAAWHDLWQAYLAFYETVLPETTYASTWRRLLDPREPIHGALAWEDDRALGLVHFIYHRSCWTEGLSCYLEDLYVAADSRGRGIGRQLIAEVYRQADEVRSDRVHWLTHETNRSARRLYDGLAERSGYLQYQHLCAATPSSISTPEEP